MFDGFSEKELRTVVAEVKLLGADIDLTVGKNTNLLITGDRVDSRKLATMRLNIEAGKDARMMDIAECRRIIKQYINELNT